jgi:hypothetical protein
MNMPAILVLLTLSTTPLLAQPLEILSARYGVGDKSIDVTSQVRSLVRNNQLSLTVDPSALGGDPAPGIQKTLEIRYRSAGTEQTAAARDLEQIQLPPSSGFSIGDLFGDGGILRIISARYGYRGQVSDVTPRLQSMVKNDQLSFKVTNQNVGGADPAVGKDKELVVVYEHKGRTYEISAKEESTLTIPSSRAKLVAAAPAPAPTPAPAAAGPAPAAPVQAAGTLRILSAVYGANGKWNDVTALVQSRVSGNAVAIPVTLDVLGSDPAPGTGKQLRVRYSLNGVEQEASASDFETLRIPPEASRGPIRVLSAVYGANSSWSDVTGLVQNRVRGNQLVVPVTLEVLGSDPAPGVGKSLRVRYSQDGVEREAAAADFDTLRIPADAPDLPAEPAAGSTSPSTPPSGPRPPSTDPWLTRGQDVAPIGEPGKLRIFYARYGTGDKVADVREKLRPFLRGERLFLAVSPGSIGVDPAPGETKMIHVIYEFRGRTYERIAADGTNLTLPD